MISGDSKPLRDLGHSVLYDPLAALENSKSSAFKEAIKDEAKRLSEVLPNKQELRKVEQTFTELYAVPRESKYYHELIVWDAELIKVYHSTRYRIHLEFVNSKKKYASLSAFGHCPEMRLYYTIEDVGSGAELLELSVYTFDHKRLWKTKPVAANATFFGKDIYYQRVENLLRYYNVVYADALTGDNERVIYENDDKRITVDLLVPANQNTIYVKTANALSQRLGKVVDKKVIWITPSPPSNGEGTTLLPICGNTYVTNSHIYPGRIHLPNKSYIKDVMPLNGNEAYIVTIKNGAESIYNYNLKTKKFTTIFESSGPCEITLMTYSSQPSYGIEFPNTPMTVYSASSLPIVQFPNPFELKIYKYGIANGIPYTFVSNTKRPIGLIVDAYGAYGILSNRGYPSRWIPWIAVGFAYAVACVHGSRDNGDDWYNAARTASRKHTTFDDTATVIKALQKRFSISPQHTIIYGRSAGGWTASAVALQYPHLVGYAFAEVPYVDVVRTTTNPRLPLTQLEYDEFGNPAARPKELDALFRISPVDSVYPAPPHAPLFYLKTAVNDVQVLPYEALKLAKTLRAEGWTAFVSIDGKGGHFAAHNDAVRQFAADFAFFARFFSKKHRSTLRKRKRNQAQSSRGKTRRRYNS